MRYVGSKDGGACYEELIPMTLKALVKMLVPPIVLGLYRRIRGPFYIWDGIYTSFQDVPSFGAGFNSDDYAIPRLNDTRRAIQIASNYRCVPTELVEEDAQLPLVASLVRRNTEDVLRILDFGGGAGISFVHLKSGLVGDMELDYHVVELEWACRMGPQLFENDHGIHFHRSLPELMEPLDIVFMKGVLMSIEDYAGLLKRLCAYRARYFLFVNLAAGLFRTFASSQKNLPGILPHWFFNFDEIVGIMTSQGYSLIFKGALLERYRQENLPAAYRLDGGRACTVLFELQTARGDRSKTSPS